MALLLALLWVPLVSHCDLEHLPGMDLLACLEQPESAPHQDEDCQTDVCGSVESANYRTEDQSVAAPVSVLAEPVVTPLLTAEPASASVAVLAIQSLPIELSVRWQFAFRAAAPPRAPSLNS